MLVTDNPNISIITNFGCRTDCWYCVWETHKLKDVRLDTDWDKLYDFLYEHRKKGKVSVSGGGDCLYKYEDYKEWWDTLFGLCNELNLLIDVHSREKFYNNAFWKEINRCVVSSDCPWDDVLYFEYLAKQTKLRIVHVVTHETTDDTMKAYSDIQKSLNCQFTIKQLVGHDDNGNYNKFRNKYPDIYHLDEGDYNIYYMPNNEITTDFIKSDKWKCPNCGDVEPKGIMYSCPAQATCPKCGKRIDDGEGIKTIPEIYKKYFRDNTTEGK